MKLASSINETFAQYSQVLQYFPIRLKLDSGFLPYEFLYMFLLFFHN